MLAEPLMHDTVSVLRLLFTPFKARFEYLKSDVADDEQPQRGIQDIKRILDISQKIKHTPMSQSTVMNEPDQSAADADPLQEQEDQPPSSTIGQSKAKTSGLVVELFDSTGLVSKSSQLEIIDLAKRALSAFPNQGDIRVRVVDDAQMSADHEQFSGIAGTTDVLTFDLSEPTDNFQSKVLDVDIRTRRKKAHQRHRYDRENDQQLDERAVFHDHAHSSP